MALSMWCWVGEFQCDFSDVVSDEGVAMWH